MAEYAAMLGEETFTFLVGPKETKFNVHPSVFKGVSEPLHKMMTNGFSETHQRTAKLPEVEPKVFGMLCEYAYGYQSLSLDKVSGQIMEIFKLKLNDNAYLCRVCPDPVHWDSACCEIDDCIEGGCDSTNFPYCGSECRLRENSRQLPTEIHCVECHKKLPDPLPGVIAKSLLCQHCAAKFDTFDCIDLLVKKIKDDGLKTTLRLCKPEIEILLNHSAVKAPWSPDPVACYHLYNVADMYMVPDLRSFCVLSIADQLQRSKPEEVDSAVAQLSDVIYEQVGNAGASDASNENQVHVVIRAHVAARIEKLFKSKVFDDMLSTMSVEGLKAMLKDVAKKCKPED